MSNQAYPIPWLVATARKIANRRLWSAQRQQVAINRAKHLEMLHSAAAANSNLMFKIIKDQRKTQNSSTNELIIENQVYTGKLLPGWAKHFGQLSQPSQNVNCTLTDRIKTTTNITYCID